MKDFTLSDYLNLINYQVNDGSKFHWKCFGPNAYVYSYISNNNTDFTITFDTVDRLVYQLEISTIEDTYRWINPEFREAFIEEEIDMAAKFSLELLESQDYSDKPDEFIELVKELLADV
jgi:hypothetical protein